MREAFDPDIRIKDALAAECADIAASRELKERIDETIREREVQHMKRISTKKLVIAVAAGCLLLSGSVFAAGHATSFVTNVFWNEMVRDYDRLGEMEEQLGYPVDAVEEFANGYRFQSMSVDEWEGRDESGNGIYTFKSLGINYEKRGEKPISLYVEKPVEAPVRDRQPDATRGCGDITLYYDSRTNKQVPPDYELTDEDRAAEASGDIYISVGTSEVELHQSSGVSWEKDGVSYDLLGFDLNLSAEEMLDMAEEILNTN
ncbi:MAG: hypothetical protein NC302_10395 [Bacteroidales bacterium]|nr:hypothetical protein [Bacteroidales bacterium]MCM1416567.1 hypothetical protein [bacterium]MCM1424603.1 hypothetical protein [bacterium]